MLFFQAPVPLPPCLIRTYYSFSLLLKGCALHETSPYSQAEMKALSLCPHFAPVQTQFPAPTHLILLICLRPNAYWLNSSRKVAPIGATHSSTSRNPPVILDGPGGMPPVLLAVGHVGCTLLPSSSSTAPAPTAQVHYLG